MGMYCGNISFKSYPVYSDTTLTKTIGQILRHDCFAMLGTWNGSHAYYPNRIDEVYFRNAVSGVAQKGFIVYDNDADMEIPYLDMSFGNVTFDGTKYKTFKTRRKLPYYDSSANYKGTCEIGARVATNDTEPGQTYPYLMRAMFIETGENTNVWKAVSGTAYEYGFIDTGIENGGTKTTIGVYPWM